MVNAAPSASDTFHIYWPNLEETVARLQPSSFLNDPARKFLAEVSHALKIAGQAASPVDTGFMRASHAELVGNGSGFEGKWGVMVGASYARFVHDGAHGRPARPWLANVMAHAAEICAQPLATFMDSLKKRWGGGI